MSVIVAVMQPYFFPYLGYFQLIAQADIFVFHDDVQYIKAGWVNRNRIMANGEARWLTLPVRHGDHALAINQRSYKLSPATAGGLLRRVGAAYHGAPRRDAVLPLVREILNFDNANVAAFNINLVMRLAAELGIETRMVVSSAMEKGDRLAGQQRVIDICRRLGATRYVNPIGGMGLYARQAFARHGIELRFFKSAVPTRLPSSQPAPLGLSIIDTLMFNDGDSIMRMLPLCELLAP